MSQSTVSSGQVSSGLTVSTLGLVLVQSGGLVSGGVVSSGGLLLVEPGGTAEAITVQSGGMEVVEPGGTGTTTLPATLFSAGQTSLATISAGTALGVLAGATLSNSTVDNGGVLVVSSGGTAQNVTVDPTGIALIESGGILSGGLLFSATDVFVAAGGSAVGVTGIRGAILTIQSGGVGSGDIFTQAATEIVAGTEVAGTITGGSTQVVASGGVTSQTQVVDGTQVVDSGGATSQTTVANGSTQTVSSGGVASQTDVVAGAQIVSAGGSAVGTTIAAGGTIVVDGLATGAAVQGLAVVSSGGVLSAASDSGRILVQSGGTLFDPTLTNGGTLEVAAGGVVSGTIGLAPGSPAVTLQFDQPVGSGSTALAPGAVISGLVQGDTIILAGLPATSSGQVSETLSGSTLTITTPTGTATLGIANAADYGAFTASVTSAGAAELIAPLFVTQLSAGQTGPGAVLVGNELVVLSGATLSNSTVNDGGVLVVSSGGTAQNVTFDTTGSALIESGGILSGGLLFSATDVFVQAGGSAVGVTGIRGAILTIQSGGVGSGDIFTQAATEIVAGTEVSGTITGGSTQVVASGGVTSQTYIASGTQVVDSGGATSQTTVANGSTQTVSSGGVASQTDVVAGAQIVSAGGSAVGTTIAAGGTIVVDGLATGAAVQGLAVVSSGGVLSAASDSGRILVQSGGTLFDPTLANGGTLEVAAGGVVSGTIGLAPGSPAVTLQFDQPVGSGSTALAPGAVISGLVQGDTIILAGLPATSSGQVSETLSGSTLTVTTPTGTATLGIANAADYGAFTASVTSAGAAELIAPLFVTQLSAGQTGPGAVLVGNELVVLSGATLSNSTVNDGGVLVVSSGGTAQNVTVDTTGSALIESGGILSGGLLFSATDVFVQAGGSAVGVTGIRGAILTIQSGGVGGGDIFTQAATEIVAGTEVSGTITGGSTQVVASGGVTSQTYIVAGTQQVDAGGTALGTTVQAGNTMRVAGLAVGALVESNIVVGVGSVVVSSGGVLSAATDSGSILVQSGGTLIDAALGNGTLEIAAGGVVSGTIGVAAGATAATLRIDQTVTSGGTALLPGAVISGLVHGDTIILAGVSATAGQASDTVSGNTLTVTTPTDTLTLDVANAASYGRFAITTTSAGVVELTAPCFAAGTCLATERGEVPVEQLRIGDRVCTQGGALVPVRWLGWRLTDCARHPRPQDVCPVRVRRDAFGPGLPRRDLVLSPDHAVWVEGALIPVRYLLNGATVVQEQPASVAYWHVELPAHDVLLAEGLPAESYLDTGNRAAFANGDGPVQLHPAFAGAAWAERACAPLVWQGPRLHAARAALHARALALGHALTDAPALYLEAGDARIDPVTEGAVVRFDLPPGVETARLVSRVGVPAQTQPDATDHRPLGVAVAALARDGQALPLDDAALGAGWHGMEPGWRWTDGAATLAVSGARVLEVTVAMTARSWLAPQQPPAEARRTA